MAKLKCALTTFLGVEDAEDDYKKNDIVLALKQAGVEKFETDFLCLDSEDFMTLTVPGATAADPDTPLPKAHCRKLQCLLFFFHWASKEAGGAINITSGTKAQYDSYRVSVFEPSQPLVPWNVDKSSLRDDALIQWKKNVKVWEKHLLDF